jgi:hypothetical protein
MRTKKTLPLRPTLLAIAAFCALLGLVAAKGAVVPGEITPAAAAAHH